MHKHVRHPCIEDALAVLRAQDTAHAEFRDATTRITRYLCTEALAELPLRTVDIETPLTSTQANVIDAAIVVVPILRAGLGMVDAVLSMVPNARVGHVGLYRDADTKAPVDYYLKLPPADDTAVHVVVDPMIATGGSTNAALSHLKSAGARHLIVMCLVTCDDGLAAVSHAHPDVPVYAAAVDPELNQNKYIVPGLGDAGDRLYGTD